ncbi:MAG: alpha-amylase family glycosyl hydrolase [Terriglobales bacterium]
MPDWPDQPWILEINAWTWLCGLSARYGHKITLDHVPGHIWDELSRTGADGVWLMGVWRRSALARRISLHNAGIMAECRGQLADFLPEDVSGSPYSIADYSVDPHLGGPQGLAEARRQLASRGLCLLLDFVPNHVAPDHPWITGHPEYFVRGDRDDWQRNPHAFFEAGENMIAHGRDPYFAPWPDTAQLNAFHPALRVAAVDTVRAIATQCDGLRCDMAMLLINSIFSRTWPGRSGAAPATEYWRNLIPQVREVHPGFLFVAEAYWDLEWELLQQGFDYCYDKRLYDRLVQGNAEPLREHLSASVDYQRRLIRFLENHDEPRAAAVFPPLRNRVAAVALMTLPGAKLLHEGQSTGSTIRLSVHLGRCPEEAVDESLRSFYQNLIEAVRSADLPHGEWRLCQQRGWPDNQSCHNLISWCWQVAGRKYVVVVNLSDWRSQGQIILPWNDLRAKDWQVRNLLPQQHYGRRSGEEISAGLYVDVDAQSFHFLQLSDF